MPVHANALGGYHVDTRENVQQTSICLPPLHDHIHGCMLVSEPEHMDKVLACMTSGQQRMLPFAAVDTIHLAMWIIAAIAARLWARVIFVIVTAVMGCSITTGIEAICIPSASDFQDKVCNRAL